MSSYINKTLLLSVLFTGFLLSLVSCDSPHSVDMENPHAKVPELPLIEGGENSTIAVKLGTTSFFDVEVSETGSNQHIATGARNGWAINVDKQIDLDQSYEGVSLYSTYGEEHWKPVNYLLNIRESLYSDDTELTYREIQAVIWLLQENIEFDLDNPDLDKLPGGMIENNQLNVDKQKVNQIISQVNSDYQSFEYDDNAKYAVVAEAPSGYNFIIIEMNSIAFDLVNLESEYGFTVAWDVNDSGQIVGANSFWDESSGMTDMGNIYARAMNNHGEVVGNSGNNAAYWNGSGVVELHSEGDESQANAINDAGQIAGEITHEHLLYEDEYGPVYEYENVSFYIGNNDQVQEIGEDGGAYGINNDGVVTGRDYSITERAYIWDSQTGMQSLGSYTGYTSGRPYAINNEGVVVGSILVSQDDSDMLMASKQNGRQKVAKEIDAILKKTKADGVYNINHVIEMVQNSTFEREAFPWERKLNHTAGKQIASVDQDLYQTVMETAQDLSYQSEAFIWDESQGMMNLGTLGGNWSTAWDVNDHGQVVGYSSIGDSESRAFIWDEEVGMIELPTLGGNSLARAINNEGQVVGYSYDEDGNFHPVMWKVSIKKGS